MKRTILLLIVLFLSGCAGVSIVPQPNSGARVDPVSQAIIQQHDSINVMVRLGEVSVRPAPIEKNYCSFWIEVENNRAVLLPLSFKDFILIDSEGHQFSAQEPDELVSLLKPEIPYLIPYPYVGYYYLGDDARASAADQFRSEASYATSRRPEYIELDALPQTDILPQAKVSGMIYFPAELRSMNGFQIRYHVGALPGQKSFPLNFGFSVEKN